MLSLTDLHKRFGATVAVDGVSLEVQPGEVFGLLGPNGAGKTTIISMAVGLLAPDKGSVRIGAAGAPTDPAVRSKLGVAPQSLAIYDDLSGAENLRFFGQIYGISGSALRDAVARTLEAVGLTPRASDRAGAYSGGMKRRLNLAVALLHDPPVLLLDEPTAGVDPQSRNSILELVRSLKQGGKTVVYTTHYMEEAERLCDRVAIMDKGRILALGTVDDLVARQGGRSVVTVDGAEGPERIETDDPVREIQAALARGGGKGLRLDRPDLESVFLALTGRRLRD